MNPLERKFLKAYDELSDAIFRHCYFRVFNRERAKELTQETFMRAWENIGEVQNLKAFLYKVANNLIIDESRKKKTTSLEDMQEEGFDITDDKKDKLIDTLAGKELIKLLERLDPKYRQVIMMRYVDDLSPKEIAEITGETENNTSVRIHRGLEQVRKVFNDDNSK
jgi:RNA polymerase sigma-70 factor (ECF subfamily)